MFFRKRRVESKNKPKRMKTYLGLLAIVMIFTIFAMPVAQAAKSYAVLQPTIDEINWEILAGVVEDENNESHRLTQNQLFGLTNGKGKEMLESLEITVDDDGGFNASDNMDYNRQGLQDTDKPIFIFGNNKGNQHDTERATTVKNILVYEINRAYKFMFGESTTYNKGLTADINQYKHNLSWLLNNINCDDSYTGKVAERSMNASDYGWLEKNGVREYFAFRMPKGYNTAGLSSDRELPVNLVEKGNDVVYITGDMIIYEAFINYTAVKNAVTPETVYTKPPGTFEKLLISGLSNIVNFITSALGLWNLDELIFNGGVRGGNSYIGGIFPEYWEARMWTFFYIVEIVAIAILFYNIIMNIYKRAQATANPFTRASSMEQIKNIFVTILILIMLPVIFKILISLSFSLTGLFVATFGEDITATDKFRSLSLQSGTLGGCLMQLVYLGAILYFNFLYTMRALIVVIMIILSPFFVMLYSTGEKGKMLFQGAATEFLANVFVQPLQALFLAVLLLLPSSSRGFENLILIYALIPFTGLVRGLIFGQSGGFLSQTAQNGANAAKSLGQKAAGVGVAATIAGGTTLAGGIAAGKAGSKKAKSSSESTSSEAGGESGTSAQVLSANKEAGKEIESTPEPPTAMDNLNEMQNQAIESDFVDASKESSVAKAAATQRTGDNWTMKSVGQAGKIIGGTAMGIAGGAAQKLGQNDLGKALKDSGKGAVASGIKNWPPTGKAKPSLSPPTSASPVGNSTVSTPTSASLGVNPTANAKRPQSQSFEESIADFNGVSEGCFVDYGEPMDFGDMSLSERRSIIEEEEERFQKEIDALTEDDLRAEMGEYYDLR